MLEVDIDRIEARRLGDAGDLDAADEAHGHGGDDLPPGQLLANVVAQDVALNRMVDRPSDYSRQDATYSSRSALNCAT